MQLAGSSAGPDLIEAALKNGANPNARNARGDTPLMVALKKNDIVTAAQLINAGSSVFASNADNISALSMIFGMDSGSRTKLLSAILSSIKAPKTDFAGESLLHYAVRANNKEAVADLLALRADKSIRNRKGEAPLDIAQSKGFQDIVSLLTNN